MQISSPDISSTEIDSIKQTLLAWMEAKALAMGPAHNSAALEPVLHGSMLRQWRTRARDMQSKDWHWNYEALKITVRPLTCHCGAIGTRLTVSGVHVMRARPSAFSRVATLLADNSVRVGKSWQQLPWKELCWGLHSGAVH